MKECIVANGPLTHQEHLIDCKCKMNGIDSFEQWLTQLATDEDEFAYRYIYDLYLSILTCRHGLYFIVHSVDQKGYMVIDRCEGNRYFYIESDKKRLQMVDYMITRYCPKTQDMSAWHDRHQQWRSQDLSWRFHQ